MASFSDLAYNHFYILVFFLDFNYFFDEVFFFMTDYFYFFFYFYSVVSSSISFVSFIFSLNHIKVFILSIVFYNFDLPSVNSCLNLVNCIFFYVIRPKTYDYHVNRLAQ